MGSVKRMAQFFPLHLLYLTIANKEGVLRMLIQQVD